jgi:hypothetical protein
MNTFRPRVYIDTPALRGWFDEEFKEYSLWLFNEFIVNINRIRLINSANLKLGYTVIEIRSPREMLYEW